jgi:hypothetical protein
MMASAAAALLLTSMGPAAAQLASTPWAMFQHDLRHTGQSPLLGPLFPPGAPAPGNVKTWKGFDKIKMFPVLGADGTIYVGLGFSFCAIKPDMTTKWCTKLRADVSGSAAAVQAPNVTYCPPPPKGPQDCVTYVGTIYVGDRDNTLTAFDPDGKVLWTYNHGFEGDIWSSPAIGPNGTIYYAHSQTTQGFGVFTALNPDGTLKWNYVIGQSVTDAPAIDPSGFIYIPSSDGFLHKFEDKGDHAIRKWRVSVGGGLSHPVLDPDGAVLYIGTTAGLKAVDLKAVDVDPNSVPVLWTFTTAGSAGTPVLAGDGTLYVGSKSVKTKMFYSINANGTLKWPYGPVQVEDDVNALPILGADGVVYAAIGRSVKALSPQGTVLWSYPTGNQIISYPVIGGNADPVTGGGAILYVGSMDWKVYQISGDRTGVAVNHVPVAVAGPNQSVAAGDLVTLNGGDSSDADHDPLFYSWSFGDGVSGSGPVVTHSYWTPANYTVTLTVNDGRASASSTLHVSVAGGGGGSVEDDFTRDDNTVLGHGWAEAQGDLVISNHELRNAAVKGNHIAVQPDLGGANQTVSASFASVDNNPSPRLGVMMRFQGPQNYYLVYRIAGGTNALRVSKIVNGTETVLKSAPVPALPLNSFFKIEGSAMGTTLKLSLDGVLKLTVTDPTFASGQVGVLLGTGTGAKQYRVNKFDADVQ